MRDNCPTGKRSYLSAAIAEEALIQSYVIGNHREGSGPINYYQCELCGNWHLTSKGDSILIKEELKKRIDREKNAYEWEKKLR